MTWFSYLHPLTKCIYLFSLFICVMTVMNPFCLAAVLLLISFYLRLAGEKGVFASKYALFIAASMILINVLFNRRGIFVLFYFLDRPVTLESLIWGVTSALTVLCVIELSVLWGQSVKTNEFLAVFGGLMPQTALLFSLTCSFASLFLKRLDDIASVLKTKGIDAAKGSLKERSDNGAQIINALVAYSLENALITAKSMKTRGFGADKRTSFFALKFRRRDAFVMTSSLLFCMLIVFAFIFGYLSFPVFPKLILKAPSSADIIFYSLFILFSALPLFKARA